MNYSKNGKVVQKRKTQLQNRRMENPPEKTILLVMRSVHKSSEALRSSVTPAGFCPWMYAILKSALTYIFQPRNANIVKLCCYSSSNSQKKKRWCRLFDQ